MSEITITIKSSNTEPVLISIERSGTILDLKTKIQERVNVAASIQRLVFKGKVLKDELSIEFYGLYLKI